MAKRMLIDATHPEETRVVVLNGTRLEEFDFETSTKKQIKGNIYLAKVTRVEPSLQAAFVEYGGNRHGFLAFSEIHPDYYRIPVSDREAMVAEERSSRGEHSRSPGAASDTQDIDTPAPESPSEMPEGSESGGFTAEAFAESPYRHDDDAEDGGFDDAATAFSETPAEDGIPEPSSIAESMSNDVVYAPVEAAEREPFAYGETGEPPAAEEGGQRDPQSSDSAFSRSDAEMPDSSSEPFPGEQVLDEISNSQSADPDTAGYNIAEATSEAEEHTGRHDSGFIESQQVVETLGGDEVEEEAQPQSHHHHYRHYKVQEVIKRRQILLIQVTKEERGNKGAALTTYLSLAGRYCVLMPNAGRGGGVSRKITSVADRRRLKDLMEELQVPDGMGVIVRTAGSERSKAEIHRDYEYLLRLWDEIRELTLRSSAPALIYEEGNLIKRAIRDLYSRDIDEILVEGEEGYRTARSFMKMLMPSHASQVKPYRDSIVPLFHRYQIDAQIDQIHNPVVQLRSGGYIVINPTEALVAIDVNSGRSTRERNIEETATKTNLEAADEIARQLRLRDLAGLIVVDFIDMEDGRNQSSVERRLKDAMRNDRARIQIGRISPFGLLELSRQRLRSSLIEASTQTCPHCNGTGTIRSTESAALVVLRALEEEGIRRRTAEIVILVHSNVAFYILNQKRDDLSTIERRYGFQVTIDRDDALVLPAYRMDRMRTLTLAEIAVLDATEAPAPIEDEFQDEAGEFEDVEPGEEGDVAETAETVGESAGGDDQPRRKKRRRKRRRGGEDRVPANQAASETASVSAESEADDGEEGLGDENSDGSEPGGDGTATSADLSGLSHSPGYSNTASDDAERGRRRRGRRGGRRRHPDEAGSPAADLGYPPPEDFARDGREALFGQMESEEETSYAIPAGDPIDTGETPLVEQSMAAAEPPLDDQSLSQEGDAVAANAMEDSASTADPGPARRPRTPRRRKADADGDAPAEAKPRRTRRPRGAAAAESAETPAAEIDQVVYDAPSSQPVRTPDPEPAADIAETAHPIPSAPSLVTEAEPLSAAAEAETPKEDEAPAGPKRAGWWRRLVQ